jgi:hypothetical protein
MGATKPVLPTENYRPMLQAMLDSFQHPVWITDESGLCFRNQPARDLEKQGFQLSQNTTDLPFNESLMVRFKGRDLSIKKSHMRPDSNIVIHEAIFETAITARLKESTMRLRSALAR